jgi:glycyl-tRNA synthetase beta chain/uncharacterized protein
MQQGAQVEKKVVALATRSSHTKARRGLYAEIHDLLRHPTFVETHFQVHHSVRKSDHLLRSASYAYWLAAVVHANRRVCARAGLLHDLHSRLGTWSTHGAIAASVADEMGEDHDVCRAIVPHMYPLGPAPRTREGWVLAVADKMATLVDAAHFVAKLVNGESLRQRRMLRATDRFLRGEAETVVDSHWPHAA